jgi:hypothetical protein
MQQLSRCADFRRGCLSGKLCRCYRLAVLLIGFCFAVSAQAVTRTWPGSAPCATTLQACIDASAAADTVLVATTTVITESPRLDKPFALRAAPGYRPVFDVGAVVSGTISAGSGNWVVEGLTLRRGFVQVSIDGGGPVNVVIQRVRVLEALSSAAEISVFRSSATSTGMTYQISENELNYFWDTSDGALRAAIQVLDSGSGITTGRIRENRVVATGNQSIGILVSTRDRTHRTEILANHVRGGRQGSIFVRQGLVLDVSGGALTALVFNNVISSVVPGSRFAAGIKLDVYDGSANLRVWHNTVTDASRGLNAFASTGAGPISGSVRNNIFAYISFIGLDRAGGASVLSDLYNLFFQSSETPGMIGLSKNTLFLDPRFKRAPDDVHLRAGSPAIDALLESAITDTLIAENLPFTDGDGLRRVKQANGALLTDTPLDIGALEAGDVSVLHVLPTTVTSPISNVSSVSLNGFADASPIVTPNWNPDGGAGIYDNHPVGFRYFTGTGIWQLRAEDLVSFTAGARFNIFAPGAGAGRFLHTNTAANTGGTGTTLFATGLNGISDRIVIATHNAGSGTLSNLSAPIAVGYSAPSWRVTRLDGLDMPNISGFNVYFQEPSINAFRHVASAGNNTGNYTLLDNLVLNGNACARVHITPLSSGILNNHVTGVFYSTGFQKWAIFNQDFATMPSDAEFNVLVDPAVSECAEQYFADGFE